MALPCYESEEIVYTVSKLIEAKYLNAKSVHSLQGENHLILSITWDGHHFLDTIRPQTIWDTTKSTALKLGIFTLNGVFQIASQVITDVISRNLGS